MSQGAASGLQIEQRGIGYLLAERTLAVPLNQRSYKWEPEDVIALFQDLANAIDTPGDYFLGCVVATKPDSRTPEIVDGQQRLATISVFIAAVRDYFLVALDDKEGAALLESKYLLSKDIRTRVVNPRLILNDSDRDFFERRVLLPPTDPNRQAAVAAKESHRLLEDACKQAEKQVKAITGTRHKSDHDKRLLDWVEFIHTRAKVIWVGVPEAADAFVIFETLNDRGRDLSLADLLKNYLYGVAKQRITEVQGRWTRMVGTLETVAPEDMAVTYIRQYWGSTYGLTRERDLFGEIKGRIKTPQKAVDFADDLASEAVQFASLLNPSHPNWRAYGTNAKQHLQVLLTLKVEQSRPLLLAVLKSLPPAEVKKVLRLLANWSVRILVAGGSPGKTEHLYCATAVSLRNGKITTAAGVGAEMAPVIPDDERFRAAFSTHRQSKSIIARYFLRCLERTAKGEPDPELVPTEDEDSVNLEHILPRNLDAPWGGIIPEDADPLATRLGNLVLLKKTDNRQVDRAEYKQKLPTLTKSAFLLTKHVTKFSSAHWGKTEIASRQQELAELALQTWPID